LLTAIGIIVLISYLAGGAHYVGLDDRHVPFSPRDGALRQAAASTLDIPFAVGWLPSSVLGRASIAIAVGRKSALRDFGAVAAALACVLAAAWLYQLSLPLYPTLLATLGLAFGSTFWGRGVAWSFDALAPVLALTGALLGRRWLKGDPRIAVAMTAALAMAVALLEDPTWVGCLPAAALLTRTSGRSRALTAAAFTIGMLGLSAAAGVYLRLHAQGSASWTALPAVQPPAMTSMWVSRIGEGAISPVAMLAGEFTPLGSVLLLIGLGVLWQATRDRALLVTFVLGLVAARYFLPQTDPTRAGVPIAVCGWLAIATALAWLGRRRPIAATALVSTAGVLVVAQPALTRLRMTMLHEGSPLRAEAHLSSQIRMSDLPSDGVIVATSRGVDAMLVLSARLANQRAVVVPQNAVHVEALVATGRPVLAFPSARTNLAALGFLFERSFAGNVPLHIVVGRQRCTPLVPNQWIDVTRQLDGGSFSVQSEEPSPEAGRVMLYLLAPRLIELRSRLAPLSVFESPPVPPDSESAARTLLETTSVRGRSNGWPITAWSVSLPAPPEQTGMTLSEPPHAAIATADVSRAIAICSASARTDFALMSTLGSAASAAMMSGAVFGTGWHTPEGGADTFRWTAAPEAVVRINVVRPGPIRVTIIAASASPPSAQPRAGLTVNHCALPDQPMFPHAQNLTWMVNAECWSTGSNRLWLRTGPLVSPASLGMGTDTRPLGARVSAIRVQRVGQ
jgi:hypothetical protein